MKIIYSDKCLEYLPLFSPELPGRVENCVDLLKKNNFELIEPKPATKADLLLIHKQALIEQVKTESSLEIKSSQGQGMYEYGLLAAGGAITAAEVCIKKKEFTFSLMRPPGHHAGKDFNGGFCYFNNIAIAVTKSLDSFEKIAILDIDCHHGNGTENIFMGQPNVLYVSLHQSPLFPETGLYSQLNCLNFTLAALSNEEQYLYQLDIALRKIYDWQPQLLAISVGFDTYEEDPLADIKLSKTSYFKIAQRIKKLNVLSFAVLEGGYNIKAMPECLLNFLQGWQ